MKVLLVTCINCIVLIAINGNKMKKKRKTEKRLSPVYVGIHISSVCMSKPETLDTRLNYYFQFYIV